MLTIAVPNKGSLAEAAAALLTEAGYRQRRDSKDLATLDADNDSSSSTCARATSPSMSARGRSTSASPAATSCWTRRPRRGEVLRSASVPRRSGSPHRSARSRRGPARRPRIATSYPGWSQWYWPSGGSSHVVRLDGAVETSVRLGVADAIADVVQTGTTLKQAGLEVFGDPILSSEAVLITRQGRARARGLRRLKRRLESVLVARTYVMMDYDIPLDRSMCRRGHARHRVADHLAAAREGWVAVRSMVPRDAAQSVMDRSTTSELAASW